MKGNKQVGKNHQPAITYNAQIRKLNHQNKGAMINRPLYK